MDGAHCIVFCFLRKHKAWNNRADVRRSCQRRRAFGEGREIWFARKRGSEDERDGAVAAETLAHCLLPAVRQWSANVSPSSPSTTANVPLRYISTSKQVERGEVSVSVSATLSLSSVYVSARWLRQLRVPTTCAKKRGERLQEESITEWLIMLSNKLHSRSSTSILSSYSFPPNAAGLQSLVPSAHLLTIVITFLLR